MNSEAVNWQPTSSLAADPLLIGFREWVRAAIVAGAATTDLFLLLMGCATGALVRFGASGAGHALELQLALSPAYFLACLVLGAYRIDVLRSRLRSASVSLIALIISAGLALATAFAFHVTGTASRLETGISLLACALYLGTGRIVGASLIRSLRSVIDPILLILGDGTTANKLKSADAREIDVNRRGWIPKSNDPQFLSEVFESVRHADRILLVFSEPEQRKKWAHIMRLTGVDAEIVDPVLEDTKPLAIGQCEGTPTLVISRGPLSLGERVLKRAFDLSIVLALAPVAIPLVGTLAALVRLESPGPAFFVQQRVGRNNRWYKCYKLRSMRVDSIDLQGLRSANRDDDRVTKVGKFLRRTSLDELPQLWNVMLGNMSLVGPRPHALGSTAEGALFWEIVEGYWIRHSVKPGITGLAQTRGFRGATLSRADLERRVASDLEYINQWSLWLDFKLVLKTVGVIAHRNAF